MCACLWPSMHPLLPSPDAMKPLEGRKASSQASIEEKNLEPGGEWWLDDGSQHLGDPVGGVSSSFLPLEACRLCAMSSFLVKERESRVRWSSGWEVFLPFYQQGFAE